LTAFRGGVSVQIKKSTASPFSVDEFLREVLVLYEKTCGISDLSRPR